MTVPKLRLGLLLVVLAGLVAPGSAAAAPVLVHSATTVTESAPRDGVVTGGDTVTILERVENTGAAAISGLQGTLTTSTAGVDVTQDASAYPTIAPFGTAENSVAFEVTLPASLPCGAVVELALALSAPGIDVTVPLTVRTGYAGSAAGYARGRATDIPNGLASLASLASLGGPGAGTSTISVPASQTGTVQGIQVTLGHLDYPLGHLRISLKGPNGAQIVLLDHRGGTAQQLDGTVFAAGGADPALTSNLSSATVRPEESFDALLGNNRAGSWKLVFAVDDTTELGTLDDWRIDFTMADCAPRAFASLVATPSQVAPNGDVALDASGTVVDGPASYAYTGSYDTISAGTTANPHVSFATRGHKTVTVNVTDGHGAVFTKDVDIVVSNLPVAVLPSPADDFTGVPITFDASGSSDADPGAITFQWSVDGGPFVAGASTRAVAFATPGAHHVTVRVTDADGAIAEATAVVTANNRPPVADVALAAPPAVTGRQTVLDASGSHDDGAIVKYRWDLDGDTTNGPDSDGFEVDGATAPTRATVFATIGAHTVRVEVTDDDGETTVGPLTFDVTNAPVAGSIQATPAQPRPNAAVTLTVAGASDSDGTIDHYEWDFGDGAQASTTLATAIHTFTTRALRNVTVRVVDDKGAGTTTSLSLSIGGVPPVAVLTAAANPVARGATAHFDASASHDPDSAISRYLWDLNGDGVFELDSGLTPTVETTYPNAGGLTVRVRVIDEDGNAGVASIALGITVPPGTSVPGGGGSSPAGPDGGAVDAGPGQQSAGDGPGAGAGGRAGFAAALAATAIQTQKAVLRSGVVVSCQTNRRATCVLRIELGGRDARRLGLARNARNPVVIARGIVRTDGTKAGVAKLRLTKAAAAKLHRAARVTVVVTGEATSAAGDKTELSRSILLRRR